jgi:hypothetical protein
LRRTGKTQGDQGKDAQGTKESGNHLFSTCDVLKCRYIRFISRHVHPLPPTSPPFAGAETLVDGKGKRKNKSEFHKPAI